MYRVTSEGSQPLKSKKFDEINPNNFFKQANDQQIDGSDFKLNFIESDSDENNKNSKNKDFILKYLPHCPAPPLYELSILKNIYNTKEIDKKMAERKNMIFKLQQSNIFYCGDLKFGRLDGNGVLMLEMIDENTATEKEIKESILYRGLFSKNRVHGKGCLYFKDDYQFEGTFNEGVANGHGKLLKNGKIIKEGIWINGKIN
jgi:hypothetical protein